MHMLEKIVSEPELYQAMQRLSCPEKAVAVMVDIVHNRVISVLQKTGRLSVIPIHLARQVTESIVWHTHQRTGLIDKMDNWDFMEDLEEFKTESKIGNDANILYIGSNNDTSASRVFPQIKHVDRYEPKRMPRNFNFTQADASNLSEKSGAVDVAIFKCVEILEDPAVVQELQRIISTDGKVISHGNIDEIDFSAEPQTLNDLMRQNKTLRQLINLYKHGFKLLKRFNNGTVLLKQSQDNDDERSYFEEIYRRNRAIFYRLIVLYSEEVCPGNVKELDIDLRKITSWDDCLAVLEPIRREAPPEAYGIIEDQMRQFVNWRR